MSRRQGNPPSQTWFAALLSIGCFLVAGLGTIKAEATAKLSDDEIIEKSKGAMQPPIQYRMRIQGSEATVSQKTLPNGVLATRTEAVAPGQTIVLCLGGRYFDILPQSEVVIDKNSIAVKPVTASLLRGNDMLLSFVPEIADGAKIESREVTSSTHEGIPCYKIETKFSFPGMGDTSLLARSLGAGVPKTHALTVNAETFNPIELSCFSVTGSLIQRYQYVEVARSVDIADTLFELPSTYSQVVPATMNEYFDLHRGFWTDIKPKPAWTPRYPKIYEAPRFEYKVDPILGIATPVATTPEQAKIYSDFSSRQTEKRTQPASTGHIAFLLVNITALVAVLVFLLVRKRLVHKD